MSSGNSADEDSGKYARLKVAQLLAGAMAGIVTKTSVAPLERMKILFQVQGMLLPNPSDKPPSYRYGTSVVSATKVVWAEEGFKGFYKGNGANCLRVIPVYALKFTLNDTFREVLLEPGQTVSDLTGGQLLFAGCLAGTAQITVTYPLELVRARLTLSEGFGKEYKGIWNTAKTVLADEGIRGFYKGYGPTFVSGSPYVGLQMTFYELFSRQLEDGGVFAPLNYGPWGKLTTGALAGVTAQTSMYWGDTLRRRMQTNGAGGTKKIYKHTFDCIGQIWRKEGFLGYFRGLQTNIMRCLPGAAIQFAAYDFFRAKIVEAMGDDE